MKKVKLCKDCKHFHAGEDGEFVTFSTCTAFSESTFDYVNGKVESNRERIIGGMNWTNAEGECERYKKAWWRIW